jgi:hypothetical protein
LSPHQRVHVHNASTNPETTMTKTASPRQTRLDALLLAIAQEHFGIETLETRRMDRLDFHDVAVWSMRAALEAAYNAGIAAGSKARKSDPTD